MHLLEQQIEKGKRLITQGKSLGKDTRALEDRVRVLEAQLKEQLKESTEKTPAAYTGEEGREDIRDDCEYKLYEIIHPEPSKLIREAPKKNVKQIEVTIMYSKGNLRIEAPDIQNLYLGIKREFPKGSIVLHDGAVYVAFYYLPVLLKALEQRFGSIEADSSIPDLEGVRGCLHIGQVPVEVELAAQLETPITKALLEPKPASEVAAIISQLKGELRNYRWVDSIWEAVRKPLALSEVINGEEFESNTKSKVDNRFSETNHLSLTNSKKLIQYQKKEVKNMSFEIAIEEQIEAGVCDLTISDVETIESKFGPALKVTSKLEDGRFLNSLFPLPATVNNKTGQLIKKLFGEFKKINSDELIGKKFRALVEHVQRDGRTYVNVSKIL